MSEQYIFFNSNGIKLEGIFHQNGENGVVITHPHPLFGGSMYNNIINLINETYLSCGYSTLRFNFRGVGKSRGKFDNGEGEIKDLISASEFIYKQVSGSLHLVGYSFGSWINLLALSHIKKELTVVSVAPPISLLDFEDVKPDKRIKLIIGASNDEYAIADILEKTSLSWNKDRNFIKIEKTDHFFSNAENLLHSALKNFLITQIDF